jgi:small GTP-binding protein
MNKDNHSFPSSMKKNPIDVSILLLGNSGVGKTLISKCIANDGPLEDYRTEVTISPEMIFVTYDLGGHRTYRMRYIDPPGAPSARELVKSYYRGIDGIIAVYDVNEPATFASLCDDWLPVAGETVGKDGVPVLVLANKMDLCAEKKLQRLLATHERDLNTGFPDRLAFVDLAATSARLWSFPGRTTPLDNFVQMLIEKKTPLGEDGSDASRISLFFRDVGEGTRSTNNNSDCGSC